MPAQASAIIPNQFSDGRHTTETASTGENVIIFANVAKPVSADASAGDHVNDIEFNFDLWGAHWALKGSVDTSKLQINAEFLAKVVGVSEKKLAAVKGGVQDIKIDFDVTIITGSARFFLEDSAKSEDSDLYVELTAKVLGKNHGVTKLKLGAISI